MKENILNLSEDTDVVFAEYYSEKSSLPFKILIVQYPDKSFSSAAYNNIIELKKSWGEEKATDTKEFDTFVDAKGRFSSISCVNGFIIATFLVETKKMSQTYVNKIIAKIEASQKVSFFVDNSKTFVL